MNNPLINPGLGTFFWMLVSFGVLVFILGKWGWPMLLKALNKREKAIADSLNAAEKAREEMRQLTAHNEDLLREAKIQRDELLRENARESINYEKLKAMHDLKNQIASLSIDIAEKLMKAELSDKQKADGIIHRELDEIHLN